MAPAAAPWSSPTSETAFPPAAAAAGGCSLESSSTPFSLSGESPKAAGSGEPKGRRGSRLALDHAATWSAGEGESEVDSAREEGSAGGILEVRGGLLVTCCVLSHNAMLFSLWCTFHTGSGAFLTNCHTVQCPLALLNHPC